MGERIAHEIVNQHRHDLAVTSQRHIGVRLDLHADSHASNRRAPIPGRLEPRAVFPLQRIHQPQPETTDQALRDQRPPTLVVGEEFMKSRPAGRVLQTMPDQQPGRIRDPGEPGRHAGRLRIRERDLAQHRAEAGILHGILRLQEQHPPG